MEYYIIIISDVATESQIEDFMKALSQDFINVKGAENIFLIVTDKEIPTNEIHETIFKRIKSLSFLVIKPDKWYGGLYDEAWNWLKEKLPEIDWVNE